MEAMWMAKDATPESTEGAGAITTEELTQHGVTYQRLPLSEAEYQGPLDAVKAANGYIEQDQVELTPDMENLDAICAKFIPEHLHTEDEVRFVLEGEGVFDIRSTDDRWMRVKVEAGDLITVPAHRNHRFFLTERKHIKCVRLFQDMSGWVPHYRAEAAE
jgi:1,2-dihydroxy-3-keto-5-methylthiopentene dioxygenase